MKKHAFYWLALGLLFMAGCQKELSFELGNTPSKGSLQSDVTGDCLPKTVNGTYVAASPLVPTANTITVQVNVARTGTYVVNTDTINGYFFRATGTFTTLGANNVTLRGNGTPFTAGIDNFVVRYDTTICDIQVTVTAPGVGTLAGAPTACAPITVNGGYSPGIALTASNNAVVQVNVTTAGLFNITTDTVAGIWFTFSGALPLGAAQNVTLQAQGSIPAATVAGNKTFTVKLGTSSCTFVVNVAAPVTGTLGGAGGTCTPITPGGTYTIGVPLTASNTVQVQITTTAVGIYSVTTDTKAGISFSASGTSNGATQTITLINNGGTPTASGPQTFTVTFGTSTCTFSITIGNGLSAFTCDCSSANPDPDGLYEVGTQLIPCANTVDIDVDVTALGPYNIITTATNGMTFTATGTFTTLGVQTITLVGSGTPLTAGIANIPMPGTTPCTFPITVDPAPLVDWQFTKTTAPSFVYRGQTDDAQLIPNGPSVAFILLGSNSLGADGLSIVLSDINGTIANGETYSTSALPTGNFAVFSYDLPFACSDTYSADPTITGVTMIFTVTSHNVATQTITGTFTGTAKNSALQTITIASGTFTGTYL
jgi:hypothetical protein